MHLIILLLSLPLALVLADNASANPLYCGGNIIQPPCPTGQSCYRWLGLNPDVSGTCVGQCCGGFVAHPQTCPSGQVCVRRTLIADIPGTCLDATHTCSTDAPCPDGWQCVLDVFAGGCNKGVNPDCLCDGDDCTGYCASAIGVSCAFSSSTGTGTPSPPPTSTTSTVATPTASTTSTLSTATSTLSTTTSTSSITKSASSTTTITSTTASTATGIPVVTVSEQDKLGLSLRVLLASCGLAFLLG